MLPNLNKNDASDNTKSTLIKSSFMVLCFMIGAIIFSKGVYMDAKAHLAQVLIEYSWSSKGDQNQAAKPWWWADTKAIATLEAPRLRKRLFVMQDDSGESLAFGPGHLNGSANIAEDGHVMIAGHRDSHFAFLQDIKIGDVIKTTNSKAKSISYRVTDAYVMDTRKDTLTQYQHQQLTLITCYPFNSVITGGPLRYIVNAEPVLDDTGEAITDSKQT